MEPDCRLTPMVGLGKEAGGIQTRLSIPMKDQAADADGDGSDTRRQSEQYKEYTEGLRARIAESLRRQGFNLTERGIEPPDQTDKESLRKLHSIAVQHRIARGDALAPKELILIRKIAAGNEVNPECIAPRLVEVMPNSHEELLFRYVSLHWSIPVSSGYGRRIRFLVVDSHNDKLIGIIGLGDPIFGLRARDQWIGWDVGQRRKRLRHVLDAYVLGAVPPYSALLGGKLVAMLATSDEVRRAFERKYTAKTSLISGVRGDARVAMITTTSALGRSSMYNRVKYRDRLMFTPVGFTNGSGEFHFANGLYGELFEFATTYCKPTAKNSKWGTGFRSRREVIRKSLGELGLPQSFNYHGVERQVFVVPLASNSQAFLRGDEDALDYYRQDAGALFRHFRNRWLLPRAKRHRSFREFNPSSFLIWHHPGKPITSRIS